ncbi:MAG: hypothetical protein JWR07_625 [Nevskia sp.]|nr:hypothetical protein [Nevskia sp.]
MKILATVQEGQFNNDQIKALEATLRRNYAEHVSTVRITVIWCVIPSGQAFTNYQPSQSSLISMECDGGFPQDGRVKLLHACEHDWTTITGQNPDQVMLSLIEADVFNDVLDGNRVRLSKAGNLKLQWHMLTSLLRSKLGKGYLSFRPNL